MFSKKIQSVIKNHMNQFYDIPAPAAEHHQEERAKKKYGAINEESSNNSRNNGSDDKDSMSQLDDEKSIATVDRGSTGGNLIDEIATP